MLFLEAFDFSEVGGAETWAEGPRSEVGTSRSDALQQQKPCTLRTNVGRQAPGSRIHTVTEEAVSSWGQF